MTPENSFIKDTILKNHATELLKQRGVEIEDIAEIVYDLQKPYIEDLTMEYCIINIVKLILPLRAVHSRTSYLTF